MSVFLQFFANPNLIGFYIGFIAMLILPITNFFISKSIFLNYLEVNQDKVNIYSAIVSVVTIYSLLIIYIFYYYYDDFKQVFCKKRITNEVKQKQG